MRIINRSNNFYYKKVSNTRIVDGKEIYIYEMVLFLSMYLLGLRDYEKQQNRHVFFNKIIKTGIERSWRRILYKNSTTTNIFLCESCVLHR